MTRSELSQDAASNLVAPSAEAIYTHQGREYQMTIDGPRYADVTSLYRSHASPDQISEYYAEQLSRLGWIAPYRAFRTTLETSARAWCKDRMLFRLGIRDPGDPGNAEYFSGGHKTVFEIALAGRDTAIQCPTV